MINVDLLKHPVNYLVVWSIALVVFYVAHEITDWVFSQNPNKQNTTGPGTQPATNGPEGQ